MNIYLINALLVLVVIRQIREHQLDTRALAVPVLAVAAAAGGALSGTVGLCGPGSQVRHWRQRGQVPR